MIDRARLEALCEAELSSAGLEYRRDSEGVIRFPAVSREVGDLIIDFDGGEITVYIGNITHVHFTPYEADATNTPHTIDDCAREAAAFVAGVLKDKWILWRYPNGAGGSYEIGTAREEWADAPIDDGDVERFVWSGPYAGPA